MSGCATDDKEQGSVSLSPFTPVNCSLQAGDGTKIGSNLLVRPSPAGKRSLPSTSQYGSSGNSHKHVKLDPGCNFSNDSNNRILRKQILEVAKLKKHTLSETIPSAMSNVQAAVTNFEDGSYKTSFVTRFAPMDVTRELAIVGKGLTFDSGGYNLKTGAGSVTELMKFDMGGAAAAIGAAKAVAAVKPLGVEVHFIVAACENMISGMRPGDILTASNGKTIESSRW